MQWQPFFWKSVILTLIWIPTTSCEGDLRERSSLVTRDSHSEVNNGSCLDTWFVPVGNSCVCGDTHHGIVSCDNVTRDVGVADCYCITFDSTRNTAVLGACLFNCVNVSKAYSDSIYHHVPRDVGRNDDNNSVCGYLHRQGTLCGQCMDEYYPAAYSYTFECIECHSLQLFYWLFYIAVAYLPLTVFVVFILVFRVSVVSPKLYGMISMTQNLIIPLNICVFIESAKHDYVVNITTKTVITVMGPWNLDFFRVLLPDICLHISSSLVIALDYLIAIYPMIQ